MADSSPTADAAATVPAPSLPEKSPDASTTKPSTPVTPVSAALASLLSPLQPSAVDSFLLRLNKCMESPLGIDAVLATVCYSARLAAVALSSAAAGRALLHAPARQLATLVRLPDSTLVLLTGLTAAPGASSSSSRGALLGKNLRALGSLMAEARLILRLWGLLPLYAWARVLVRQLRDGSDAAKSPAARLIGWTQLLSCVAFQAYENGAYLAQRGVLNWSAAKQARAYRWSSRAFTVYVAVELARLVHEAVHRRERSSSTTTTASDKEAAAETFEVHRSLVRYAAMAPVMAHWSVEKGFLGEASQAVLGLIPAALQMHKTWGETAV